MATVEGGASAVRGDGIGERLLTYIGAKGSLESTFPHSAHTGTGTTVPCLRHTQQYNASLDSA